MIILIILIILVLLSFTYIKNLFKSDTTILDDVKLKENKSNNNVFALMLEQDDGTYIESSSSSWPTDMKFNNELSGCIDVNGNKIGNALSFDSTNNLVNVSVGETAYCYLYFDIKPYCEDGETLGECLLRKNSEIDSLNDNIEGGLYRYQGTNEVVNNNYICFGTTDKDTCLNDLDKYMYRIIGIDENNQIKLMKYYDIGKYSQCNRSMDSYIWSTSDIYKGLNGIEGGRYDNLFVNNSTYDYMNENSNWYNKIIDYNWKYGTLNGLSSSSAEYYYDLENSFTNSVTNKIGLIYIYDYLYSVQKGGQDECSYSYHSGSGSYSTTCKETWIIGVGWTMARINMDEKSSYSAYFSSVFYHVKADTVDRYHGVFPTFFINNGIEYLMGTGTSSDPFIINE